MTPELAEVSGLFAEGRYATAIDALSRTAGTGDDPHLLLCRGLLHWANDDVVPALESLEQAELALTFSPITYCVLAECYIRQSQMDHARTVLVGLGIDDSLGDEFLGPLARGLYDVGEHGRLICVCHLAAACYPEADEPWWWIAENFAAMGGDERRRLAALHEAYRRSPGDSRYTMALERRLSIGHAGGTGAEGLEICESCEAALFSIEETASLQPVLEGSLERIRLPTCLLYHFKHQQLL